MDYPEFNNTHEIYEAQNACWKLANWYSLRNEKKKDNYIWDEDLTVRQNREKTIEHNKAIDEEISRRENIYRESSERLEKGILRYIQGYFTFSDVACNEQQARYIWEFCKTHHEDEPHNWIDDVCELFGKLMEAAG